MRRGRLLVFLLLALALPGQGQEASPFATDPPGDVQASGAATAPAESSSSVDLLGLDLAGTPATLNVTFRLADLVTARPVVDSAAYYVDFGFDGSRYLVEAVRILPVDGGPVYEANLLKWDDGFGYWRPLLAVTHEVDTAAGTFRVELPMQELTDPTGLPVRNGSHLTDLVAYAMHGEDRVMGGGFMVPLPTGDGVTLPLPFLLHDRLPDTGVLDYLVSLPITGGEVLLDSPDPVRATNGGPGTFVYPVRATNAAPGPVVVDLAVEGLPEGWTASIVDTRMELAAGESRITNAVVKPPFAHTHGSSTNITVRAAIDGRPTESLVVLQLVYSDPPQPAGHHPRLHLHTTDPEDPLMFDFIQETTTGYTANRVLYMNTDEEDLLDNGQPKSGDYVEDGVEWRVPMSPGLGMGLDFDTAGFGHVTVSFAASGELAIEDATFQAQLLLATKDGDTVLAESARSAPLAVQDGTEVALDLAMTPAADYVPYAPDTNLVLRVHAAYTEPGAEIGLTDLSLLGGGWLELPLLEYQDQVPLQGLGALTFQVDPETATANPGDLVSFKVTLRNAGASAVSADVEALDVSADSVLGIRPGRVRVPAGGGAVVEVDVLVAEEAIDGELFNAFVAVRPEGEPTSSLVRLTTLVTTEVDVESAATHAPKDTPGPHWLLAVAALGLASARRRVDR